MRQARIFPRDPGSTKAARLFVLSLMDGLSEELRDVVEVMVSELATNVQLHTAGGFEVTVARSEEGGRLRVEVADRGMGEPRLQQPTPEDLHGRGLQIVRMLSDSWGTDRATDHRGKTVWFELRVGPPDQRPAGARRAPAPQAQRGRRVRAAAPRSGGKGGSTGETRFEAHLVGSAS